MSDSQIIDLYDDLISMEDYYHVQDYNGLPGDTISRDHEIRYFAIDNRLYPRAGRYTADYNYNQGQTTINCVCVFEETRIIQI